MSFGGNEGLFIGIPDTWYYTRDGPGITNNLDTRDGNGITNNFGTRDGTGITHNLGTRDGNDITDYKLIWWIIAFSKI